MGETKNTNTIKYGDLDIDNKIFNLPRKQEVMSPLTIFG